MPRKPIILLLLGCATLARAQTPCFTAANSVGTCAPPMVQVAVVNGTAQTITKASSGAGTTITQAFPNNTTKGNTLLCLGMESAAATPTFTDSASNTFVPLTGSSSSTAPGITAAIAQNIAGGADTITETTTSGAAFFACHELQGSPPFGVAWDIVGLQQGTGSAVPFAFTGTTAPNEMIFTVEGFTTGQTVNATPLLGGQATGLITVDAANSAVSGGAPLAVAYAAHGTLPSPVQFTQSVSLSASVTYSGLMVSIRPVNFNQFGTSDPCQNAVQTPFALNVSSTTQIVAGTAGQNVYVCRVVLPPQAVATNFNLIESATSGNACATSPTGMLGGSTAALGANIVINGGWIYNGPLSLTRTATAGDAVCAAVSASTNGVIWYVKQ